ncbi:hypothetical protein NEF87_003811 [Candidatus Lokiarchaeum ossiferum]|uniref:Choloylglycine hydrolase/NAAA C-terminal domain-containing protein n=1 Tax=Candidatus Lokiarchaeum ossiferum TaxID=2951803 RepID=A0ABY6HVW0_9ARCH|nr:hypothetical protein NEF87_003811 [Candidatus Lokiarchaeum sp. B-35]
MVEKATIQDKKRKSSRRITLGIILLCIIGVATTWSIKIWNQNSEKCIDCSNSELTLQSLVKLDTDPFYYIELWGDYGFEQYLQAGINEWVAEPERLTSQNSWACSIFATLNNNNDFLYGRNFDWKDGPKLLVFTNATNAYASYSMVDLGILGFSSEKNFLDASYDEYLQAAYCPLDGMNEYGLSIGCMTASGSENILNLNKIKLGSLEVMRLALDYATSVDETILLWRNYSVDFVGGPPLHYLIADASGNSAIIEFTDGEMQVILTENPWQTSTNFLLYESDTTDKVNCWRYSLVESVLKEKNGELSTQEAMDLLEDVAQDWSTGGTQWSNIFNMNTKEISIVIGMDYSKKWHTFTFP